ncbi:hypothetical protein [Pseudomonas sp.]|uniref:hypothetical protein n=1 Tax=Pseudomonas sp. TaxID=306 RepID=UPI001B02A69A|nr:hypothetical protein [Pseudomonas sp.]MBO9548065.1 hypothetical protein [Pseudomonas sp.]
MEKTVLGVLQNFHSEGLYVAPDIPRKKADNATASYGMPSSVKVFAIVDSTVFGSAKNGLAFTSHGLFWKNDWTTTSAKTHMPWEEFKSTSQGRATKGSELLLGNGCAFGMAGSSMKPKVLLQLMEKLAEQLQEPAEPAVQTVEAPVAQPVASQPSVAREEPVHIAKAITPDAAPEPEPVRKPAFDGSYQQDQLQIVNAVAKRHRLSHQIQVAPSIKVYKVEKVIEISAGRIKPYDILMIVDNTFLQTAKDFMVVTAKAVWAKGTLRKLEQFPISEIRSIRCEAKNLYINDYDFQYFDQLSENEVLVMTNMLKELVVALGRQAQASAGRVEPQLPRLLDNVLSAIYDDVINDTVTRLRLDNPQGRELITTLTDSCFATFLLVSARLQEHQSSDRAEMLGQYLLAQTLATVFALRSSDELWSSLELQVAYMMIQGRLIYRVFGQTERSGVGMYPGQEWYVQVLRSVMEADSLDEGLEALREVLGQLTRANQKAIEAAFECADQAQELFIEGL